MPPKLILIVDDDPSIAATLRMILEDEGYRLAVAVDGRDALRLMAQERPALVISDVVMPIMGGVELARCIHDDPDLRAIPVVLMSAMREARPSGLASLMAKPFDLGAMVDLVAELTSRRDPTGGRQSTGATV